VSSVNYLHEHDYILLAGVRGKAAETGRLSGWYFSNKIILLYSHGCEGLREVIVTSTSTDLAYWPHP
jgi:hypothetical protein